MEIRKQQENNQWKKQIEKKSIEVLAEAKKEKKRIGI